MEDTTSIPATSAGAADGLMPLIWFTSSTDPIPAIVAVPLTLHIQTDPDVQAVSVSATGDRETVSAPAVHDPATPQVWTVSLALPATGPWILRAQVTSATAAIDLANPRCLVAAQKVVQVSAPGAGTTADPLPAVAVAVSPASAARQVHEPARHIAMGPLTAATAPTPMLPGDPGGGSGPGPDPNPGQPWTYYANCAITYPVSSSPLITGAEPGFVITATGTASAGKTKGEVDLPGTPDITVLVDGNQPIPGTFSYDSANGTWSASFRIYPGSWSGDIGGDVPISAWADYGNAESTRFNTQFPVIFDSKKPVIHDYSLPAGTTIGLHDSGGEWPVTVTMAESAQYGTRAVSVVSDLGDTRPLAPVPGSTTQFSGSVFFAAVDTSSLGNRFFAINANCGPDRPDLTAEPTVVDSLTAIDLDPPDRIQATSPPAVKATPVSGATGYTVTITGIAHDKLSGMAGGSADVEVALTPTGTPAKATAARTPGDLSDWYIAVTVPQLGPFQIFAWATDAAGNTTDNANPWSLGTFTAVDQWAPPSLEDRLGPAQYLHDLADFAVQNVVGVAIADLDNRLGQPVSALSQTAIPPAPAILTPVNELRVPIEVLRRVTATMPAPDESDYLLTAYHALLAGIGTSYVELREARGAAPADRAQLAERLGVALPGQTSASSMRPDRLDAITLDPATGADPGTLTEQALQDLFGLAITSASFDPASPPPGPSDSNWCRWQMETQRSRWQREDRQPPIPVAYTALADPDLITAGDLAPNAASTPVGARVIQLLAARASDLQNEQAALASAQSTHQHDPDSGLGALLTAANLGMDLTALHAQELAGADIAAQLAAAGLDRVGFAYLLQLQALAAAPGAVITTAEWADAVNVLTGAYRRRRYLAWLQEEQGTQAGQGTGTAAPPIVLSPDTFAVGPDPAPSALRIDPAARRDWRATLRARTLQRQALLDSATQMVVSVEQAALPILRDLLLAAIAAASPPPIDPDTGAPATPGRAAVIAGEQITNMFKTDVLVAGKLTTSRVEQATTSLQALLIDTRANTTGLVLAGTGAEFDQDWTWIGTIDAWRAATTTFLFPEGYLDPMHLNQPANSAFDSLRENLFGNGMSVTDAKKTYVDAINAALQGLNLPALSYDDPSSVQAFSALLDTSTNTDYDPALAVEVCWAAPVLLAQRLQADRRYQEAVNQLAIVYPDASFDRVANELAGTPAPPPELTLHLGPGWSAQLNPFTLVNPPAAERPYPYLRATLLTIAGCLLEWADAEFSVETDESIAHARELYREAIGLLDHDRFTPVPPGDVRNAALRIPRWTAQRTHAVNQLDKIRADRNIAGLPRSQAQFSGPAIGQPTPYHFKVLLARAQQLTQQASGLEAQYLAALEKFSNATLTEFDAANAAGLAAAQLAAHDAQVKQATDGVAAAQAQQNKAMAATATLSTAIASNANGNAYEQDLFHNYDDIRSAQDTIAAGDLMVGLGQAAAEAASAGSGKEGWMTGVAAAAAALDAAGAITKSVGQFKLNDYTQSMERNQLSTSIENRLQEWRMQLASAQQDVLVARAQVTVATDQVTVAQKERDVAALQVAQAQARLQLIQSLPTNAALYKWLGDTLGGIYRYFLQRATATARLAQAQLAFERAELQLAFLQTDYWQPPNPTPAGAGNDVRGLAGAERLAEDLAKMDGYAFSTDTRRLNLSQTFSLAQLAPMEYLDFKRTGQLSFATPAVMLDQDFPGHYHRLIRQVHLSVVALVPPSRGIRATLASNGISRVVVPDDSGGFGEVVLRRDPTVVSFTTPVDATGVFTVDLQPDMLLPFEGAGVDTTWDLQLPPTANPFDYRTISDVLLTLDYTALVSYDYQAQIIRQLNASRDRRGSLAFSLARDFPDQWYALHNPDAATAAAGQRSATLTLRPGDFPPTLDPASPLLTADVAVRLSSSGSIEPITVTLAHTAASPGGVLATAAGSSPVDPATGIVSTRRGGLLPPNGQGPSLQDLSPVGDWSVTFQPPPQAAGDPLGTLFGPGGLDDVVLLISWSGQSLPWLA